MTTWTKRDCTRLSDSPPEVQGRLQAGEFAVVTLHRPSNVDRREILEPILGALGRIGERAPVVFPVHPCTKASLENHRLMDRLSGADGVVCIEPLNYVRFMSLVFNCRLALTDSGGIQEEVLLG